MKKLIPVVLVMLAMLLTPAPAAHASTCFQDYENDILDCSYLSWGSRELCNLDAAVDLTACVRDAIF